MQNEEIKERAEAERERIRGILKAAKISENRMSLLEPVIENTAWMSAKLDDARDAIKNGQIVIPYDNGGGQKGLRESPLFKGYESLFRSYIAGMTKILDALPEETEGKKEEIGRQKTMLEIVRERHRA